MKNRIILWICRLRGRHARHEFFGDFQSREKRPAQQEQRHTHPHAAMRRWVPPAHAVSGRTFRLKMAANRTAPKMPAANAVTKAAAGPAVIQMAAPSSGASITANVRTDQ